MKLLGLAGKAGTGKDTLARRIQAAWGYAPVAFAWQLKHELIALREATWDQVFVAKPPAIRQRLIDYGMQMRAVDPDYWIRHLEAQLRSQKTFQGITRFVITDVRFENEAEWIHRQGGTVLWLEAPRRAAASNLTEDQRAHESETTLYAEHPLVDFPLNLEAGPPYVAGALDAILRVLEGEWA
jgi:hypothetical protein